MLSILQPARVLANDKLDSASEAGLNLVRAPIRRINIGVQFLRTGDAQVGGVPIQKLAGEAVCKATEQKGVGDRTLELEAGARCLRSSLTCGEPLIDGSIGPRCAWLPGRRLVLVFG